MCLLIIAGGVWLGELKKEIVQFDNIKFLCLFHMSYLIFIAMKYLNYGFKEKRHCEIYNGFNKAIKTLAMCYYIALNFKCHLYLFKK